MYVHLYKNTKSAIGIYLFGFIITIEKSISYLLTSLSRNMKKEKKVTI